MDEISDMILCQDLVNEKVLTIHNNDDPECQTPPSDDDDKQPFAAMKMSKADFIMA